MTSQSTDFEDFMSKAVGSEYKRNLHELAQKIRSGDILLESLLADLLINSSLSIRKQGFEQILELRTLMTAFAEESPRLEGLALSTAIDSMMTLMCIQSQCSILHHVLDTLLACDAVSLTKSQREAFQALKANQAEIQQTFIPTYKLVHACSAFTKSTYVPPEE